MTPAEHRMAQLGRDEELRGIRLASQYAAEDDLRGMVERATGRRVRAFTSGHDVQMDVATQVFVLEPA